MLLLGGNEILRRLCFFLIPFLFLLQLKSTPKYLTRAPCPSSVAGHAPGTTPIAPSCLTVAFLPPFSPPTEVPVSSVLCLSSVRELPVQVRDLYAQGFVLVAVHPFVHPCGPRHARIQRQLHRAVLVRETPRYASAHVFTIFKDL